MQHAPQYGIQLQRARHDAKAERVVHATPFYFVHSGDTSIGLSAATEEPELEMQRHRNTEDRDKEQAG